MDDVCAHDLNQSADGISSELNIEDKLENSQENILNTNVESDEQLSAGQNEILGITPTGNTFQSINDAIERANEMRQGNASSDEAKVRWLDELDKMAKDNEKAKEILAWADTI